MNLNGNLVWLVEFTSPDVNLTSIEVTANSAQGAENVVKNMYGPNVQFYRVNPIYK
jgi:hypothetical protein|tara:strand:+ start:686 stop:853 length:168 start_codon:yes stop_codon:yes gene_type:complete